MARRVHMARKDRDRKVRMVWARKASTPDKLFLLRVRLATFGHSGGRLDASRSMLEICRSRPRFLHPSRHPLDRDNNRGERVPSEPWQLGAGEVDLVLVHEVPVHKTVPHRDSRIRHR
jgi:hypothetical protein